MSDADRNHKEKKMKKKRLPKGVSPYQEGWIDDDYDVDYSDNDEGDDDGMIVDDGENGFEFDEDQASLNLRDSDGETETEYVMMDGDNLTKEQIAEQIRQIKEEHAEDEDPHKEIVSLVDPLSHRNRDNSWKEVVNKAITMFNAKIGRRGKKQPNWEIIKAPLQPDNKQCGFFVMRYMREIIDELADNGSISLKSHFEHRRYSQEEIDEVRIEWANCVLEHI